MDPSQIQERIRSRAPDLDRQSAVASENPYAPARSYAPIARSNSTSSLEQRVSATRWKADELRSHIAASPAFQVGPVSRELLDHLVREYQLITGDRVHERRNKKRNLIAACYRIHGHDFLPFVADVFRTEGSAQNLLGALRRAEPRGRADDEVYLGDVDSDASPASPSPDTAAHAGTPCQPEVCLPSVIYCETHRPPFDASSSRRYDRQPSDADVTDDPDSGADVG